MIVIACVDDNFGLMFNKRRQSRDRKVIDRIYEISKGKKLFVNSFSQNLFDTEKITVTDKLADKAGKGEYIFLENTLITDFTGVEKIILYFWNRAYPSDFKFKLPNDFKETKRFDFEGFSHEKITEVEYEKEKS